MAVTLNASTSAGLVQSADLSGAINIQSNGTTVLGVTSTGISVTGTQSVSGNLSFNSGYGSSAVAYGCRAWVNFDGTGTVAIRGSGNVSSITDNGTGLYTVNLTNAMPDANYCALLSKQNPAATNINDIGLFNGLSGSVTVIAPTTSSYAIMLNNNQNDSAYVMSAIFR